MGAVVRAAVVVVASAGGFVACSLGGFTGYSSGGVDPNDAAGDATTTGALDAGDTDGSTTPDGGGAGDGGLGEGGVCTAMFCDDFEKGATVGMGWDVVIAESGGELTGAAPPMPVHSGARAVRIHTPVGTSARAFLEKKFTTTTKHATFSFWMNMPTPARVMQIARIRLDAPDGKSGNFVLQSKSNGTLVVGEQYYDGVDYVNLVTHGFVGFQPNVWQQWTMEVDATTSPPHGKLYVGGVLASDDALTNPFVPGVVRVYFGNSYSEDGAAFTSFFDDVSIDFVP